MKNFEFKKSLGQNFISDENIVNKIVDRAMIDKDTLVIEIGPGAGSLSKKIVPLAGYAILYEIDKRLKEILERELAMYDNYKIIFNDFLLQNVKKDIEGYKYGKIYVVANLPYYITSPIIIKLLKEIYPDRIVIMVQEEVALRLSAKEGSREYGMISCLLGSKYNITKLFKVNRGSFQPVPNVDSAVIMLDKHNDYVINDIDKYERLLKDAFQFKRKNLKNNLYNYDLVKIGEILNKYNLSLTNRAEEIPIKVFVEIVNNI
ncbi:MAG: 16S rRNA (adenine(1518)-N(6)/adenine(1519)-N(6))-dimethyltransferase RsmA [Mycoplasmatota bacterium]|nr:16S rRNA (adenine(1518)-N(6)/adenine(1519)-N(6))-dimethyltransferase RsmA [Mycoplasmatota bacterium]